MGIQVACVHVRVRVRVRVRASRHDMAPPNKPAQYRSSVAEAAQAVLSLQRQHAAADGRQNIKTISS